MKNIEITKEYARELVKLKEIRVILAKCLNIHYTINFFEMMFPLLKSEHNLMLFGLSNEDSEALYHVKDEKEEAAILERQDQNSICIANGEEILYAAFVEWIEQN